MPFNLSLPVYAASGIALIAVFSYVGWPKIRLRTYNKTLGGLRVMEIALILSRARTWRPRPAVRLARAAELVVYVTLKTGNL